MTLKSPKITPISTINDTESKKISKSDSNDSNGEKCIQNCHSQMKRYDINKCDSNGEQCNSKSDSDKIYIHNSDINSIKSTEYDSKSDSNGKSSTKSTLNNKSVDSNGRNSTKSTVRET